MPYVQPFDRLVRETTHEDASKSPWVSLTCNQNHSARYKHLGSTKYYSAAIITIDNLHSSTHNHLLADDAVDAVLAKWRAGVE